MQRAVNSQKQSFLVRNETVKFLHSYIYIYPVRVPPATEWMGSHLPATVPPLLVKWEGLLN
jgi:hypothetical protein